MTLRITSEVTRHVPHDGIVRVEVSDHQPALAAVAGIGMGISLGIGAHALWSSLNHRPPGLDVLLWMPAGAVLGAVIGTIMNSASAEWAPVYIDPVSGPGVRVGARFTFR